MSGHLPELWQIHDTVHTVSSIANSYPFMPRQSSDPSLRVALSDSDVMLLRTSCRCGPPSLPSPQTSSGITPGHKNFQLEPLREIRESWRELQLQSRPGNTYPCSALLCLLTNMSEDIDISNNLLILSVQSSQKSSLDSYRA